MSTDKTLADAQPGGRVRLGDQPWPEIDAILADAYSAGATGLPFEGIARRAAVRKAVASLSAQPSPGGQGDSRSERAATFLRQYLTYLRSSPRQGLRPRWCDVYEALEVAIEALAARQPVEVSEGEFRAAASRQTASAESNATAEAMIAIARQPVGQERVAWASTGATGHKVVAMPGLHKLPYGDYDLYAAPPAQAVDLGDLKALYRAYVHLLESGRDRIIDLGGTCDPVDVMEANDVDLQAARRVLDGQAVGNG